MHFQRLCKIHRSSFSQMPCYIGVLDNFVKFPSKTIQADVKAKLRHELFLGVL